MCDHSKVAPCSKVQAATGSEAAHQQSKCPLKLCTHRARLTVLLTLSVMLQAKLQKLQQRVQEQAMDLQSQQEQVSSTEQVRPRPSQMQDELTALA